MLLTFNIPIIPTEIMALLYAGTCKHCKASLNFNPDVSMSMYDHFANHSLTHSTHSGVNLPNAVVSTK